MIPIKKLSDGNEIPMIGLGTWLNTDRQACVNAIKMALDIGYRHIDTADIYENHIYIAQGIKGFNREKLFITSKLWRDFLDPKKVEDECDKILMQLGIDYLDLFLIHWPDISKPLAEISYEMLKLKEKGKIKSAGVSNYTIHHIQDLLDQNVDIVMNQVEYHPLLNQEELLEFCSRHSIAITSYSPLARGDVFKNPLLQKIAHNHNKTPGQISLRWLIQKDMVVIPKASSYEHIKENFEIFDFELNKEEVNEINDLGNIRKKRIIKPEFSEFDY